ncbi:MULTISPECIES: LPO_1073/Vpar_1526 family protein [Paraburkholderia]|uniref:LPO_1073/Vpar_1526 family protein n=1 Tax=Paraburkholderia TaxID=1822464 RepID=UPI00225B0E46|nr:MULTISPECIES: LPO_1073/Vpar_1526 family protein [Paraburkholderia]MCX4177742.1 hypothetical protein [Paraburkholderia madseniana]MDQ6465729.1 hypothetical protein [Paraburkholderia madseniana]
MALGQQQAQEGGDNAVNAQAGRDVVIVGVTYTEARQIALDVYRANAIELAGLAQQTACERAEHITERFLTELQSRHPEGLQQTGEPDFQHSILEAQKAYARSGDEKLETVLVDLLIERAAEQVRSLRQLVLTQSIETISRLTSDRLATCAPLKRCLETGEFRHALVGLEKFAENTNDTYPDVKQVLAVAAIKQTSIGGQMPSDLPARRAGPST